MKMKHKGNGVEFVGASGAVYRAGPGEVVEFLAVDADALKGHPEWSVVRDKISKKDVEVVV